MSISSCRDSDPNIVSQTLRALAEIVPILGPDIVIGKNQSKVFSDGSPIRSTPDPSMSSTTSYTASRTSALTDMIEMGGSGGQELSARVPPIGAEFDEEADDCWDSWGEDNLETVQGRKLLSCSHCQESC